MSILGRGYVLYSDWYPYYDTNSVSGRAILVSIDTNLFVNIVMVLFCILVVSNIMPTW